VSIEQDYENAENFYEIRGFLGLGGMLRDTRIFQKNADFEQFFLSSYFLISQQMALVGTAKRT
jgi:hypothetical protein